MTLWDTAAAPNPWPAGSAEAAEHDAITARLRDPRQERRAARLLEDAARSPRGGALPDHGELVDDHAAAMRQLATAGVLFGPDCAFYQGAVNWPSVRAAGCLIGGYKVSEGRTYQDPQHQANRRGAAAAGLVPLAYHYLFGSAEYVAQPALWAAQADWFCSLADPAAIHALDVEAACAAPGLGVARWVAAYRRHYPAKPLLVYSNRGMWVNRSHVSDPWPQSVGSWHAGVGDGYYTGATGSIATEYANTAALRDSLQQLGAPAARLWQITDHASVPGVAGTCDGNAFLGTLADLKALAAGTQEEDIMATLDELKQLLDARLDAHDQSLIGKLLGTDLGSSGPNVAVALQSGYNGIRAIAAQTDTLEGSEASQATAIAQLQAALSALPDAVVAKLGTGSADAAQVRQAVADVLDEKLPTTFVAVAPGQQPAAARE